MSHLVETSWMGKMEFHSAVNGHTVVMDGPEKVGGENHGPIPKPFLLTALSGCTGMDVISILSKSRKPVTSFNLSVTGDLTTTQPLEYSAVHIVYNFEGPAEYEETALKAVALSQEKYCGVSSMLKKIIPVTWDVLYNGKLVFTNKELVEENKQ